MIKALVQNKAGTNVIIEMPCDGYHLSCRPWDRTSRIPPSGLRVSDDNDGGVRITLTAENPAGEQLISVFGPRNTLSDVNNVVNAVANARPEVRREMEQRILSGRYSGPDDVLRDVRAVTQEMAPVKLSFFCPLKGQVNEWDGGMEDTYNSTLLDNQEKIEALLAAEQQPEDGDMAEYLVGDNSELYAKLYLAEFCVEEIGGQLYGRIDCWFTQRPDEDEIDYLREEIIGQAADGFGEHFEQQPIRIDEGDLYVSFWDSGDDYFMYTDDEMDDYLHNPMTMGGLT